MKALCMCLCIILLFGMDEGFTPARGDVKSESFFLHQIQKKGVQDFSDGAVTVEERPIEISEEGNVFSVLGTYYECSLTKIIGDQFLTFKIGDSSITFGMGEQSFGKLNMVEGKIERDRKVKVVYKDVHEDMDVQYTFLHHKVLEEVVLYKFKYVKISEQFEVENAWMKEEDGGIHFYSTETGKEVFFIPGPVMYEEGNKEVKCYDLHYEIEMKENKYVIHKIIDEKGIEWLKTPERVYPVIVDSTTEGALTDPWEESGLLPYGQYFKFLNEYVSPANGSLTVSQTDFYLPGRGMDVVVKRIYTTPQAFVPDRDGNNEIYVMNADGTNQVNLTNNPSDDRDPSWCCQSLQTEKPSSGYFFIVLVLVLVSCLVLFLYRRIAPKR